MPRTINRSCNLSRQNNTVVFIRRMLSCYALLALLSLCSSRANSDEWQHAPVLPYKVQEIYPTVYQQHIVVAGGLYLNNEKQMGVSDRVLFYSLKEKVWKDGPKLPEARHHPMLVAVGERLFSFGGFVMDEQGIWHNSLDVLELVAGEADTQPARLLNGNWKKLSRLPAALAETLSAVNAGKVHLVSGRTPIDSSKNSQWIEQTDVNTHYIFDVESLSWTEGKPIPTARNSACSVQRRDKLHTIGGRTVAGGNLATHEVYDFKTGKWHTQAPLPQAQGGLACAEAGGKIYVFGGEFFDNGGGVYSDVWEYTPSTDSWQSVSTMPTPRHGLGALKINDKIYVIAGAAQAGGNQTTDLMTIFSPQ